MASLNKVFLMGNVTGDVELRYTQSGTAVAEFCIAVNERYGEKESTVFVNVTVWNKQAENCSKYVQKGSPVLVEGRWSSDTWDDKETGKKRRKDFVTANNVQFLGTSKQEQQPQQEQRYNQADRFPAMPNDNEQPNEDDIPFN
jgi:single-strand DNA-binding protein